MKVFFIKRRWLFLFWMLLGVLLIGMYILKIIDDQSIATFASPIRGRIIVIDPGHGGIDPGAVSKNGTKEDSINLSISNKLKAYFEKENAKVIMTRTDEDGVYDSLGNLIRKKGQDMQRRIDIISNSNADAVISIHLNYFSQSQYYGGQTFYMKGSAEGEKLAMRIQSKLIEVLGRGNKREAKPVDNLRILKAGAAPSVLVECGFLSNPEEEQLLKDPKYQEQVAWAIYSGIVDYFAQSR